MPEHPGAAVLLAIHALVFSLGRANFYGPFAVVFRKKEEGGLALS